jgi:probable phosphoglycerate mutase
LHVRVAELWVVRHGETAWSAAGRHTSWTDVPLTPAGEDQARALAPRLARHWDLVLCSPRQRARRTAELAGVEATVDEDLREWEYGDAEGRTTEELSRDRPWNQWDGPLGEPLEALANRVRGLLARLPDGDVLLVAHGHVLRVLTAVHLGLEPVAGRHLVLGPGRIGVLGHEHTWPAVLAWNT